MVNENIQGVIPIDGVGYKPVSRRPYQGGEYRRLVNVQLDDGIIRSRRNIQACDDEGDSITAITNPFPFIGNIGENVLVASKTHQFATDGGGGYDTLWAPTSLTVPAGAGSFHKIVGAFKYNDVLYWITHQHNAPGASHKLYLYWVAETFDPLSTYTFASLTQVEIASETTFEDYVFCNFFIQGERLWIVTSKKVYFSKATDPKVFAVPDGGFFRFQEQKFHWGMFLRDTIYLLCDTAIFAITYTADPNVDAYARQLSDDVGGDHGTIHTDTPYFINKYGIFVINNSGIEKVMDNDFDLGQLGNFFSRIVSFENYLIVNYHYLRNYDSASSVDATQYFNNLGFYFDEESVSTGNMNYNTFFINTDTGAVHVLDFKEAPDAAEPGYLIDIYVNATKDFFRSSNVFFLSNRFVSLVGSTYTYAGHIFKMGGAGPTIFVYDTSVKANGVIGRFKPNVDIEIRDYAPDGNEHFLKRFRSLLIMGALPFKQFQVSIAYDNADYMTPVELITSNLELDTEGTPRFPVPCRLGLNQRARSISLRFQAVSPYVPMTGAGSELIYDHTEISDIRVLWQYTARAAPNRTPTDD